MRQIVVLAWANCDYPEWSGLRGLRPAGVYRANWIVSNVHVEIGAARIDPKRVRSEESASGWPVCATPKQERRSVRVEVITKLPDEKEWIGC